MERIGAYDVELTTDDLREIENAVSEVTVQGGWTNGHRREG
jgi:hypothetical protein